MMKGATLLSCNGGKSWLSFKVSQPRHLPSPLSLDATRTSIDRMELAGRYNPVTKKVRNDIPKGTVPPLGQCDATMDFFERSRNPLRLDYDPEEALEREIRDQVPGSVWRGPYYDEEKKKNYYYNRISGESTWKHPHADRVEAGLRARAAAMETGGWIEFFTNKDKKDTYWYNVLTGKSKWEKPDLKNTAWTKHEDKNKTPYWFNKFTGESQWDKPEPKQREPIVAKDASYEIYPIVCGCCRHNFTQRIDHSCCKRTCCGHLG